MGPVEGVGQVAPFLLTAENAAPRKWFGTVDVYFSSMLSSSSVKVNSGIEPIVSDVLDEDTRESSLEGEQNNNRSDLTVE